MTLPTRPSARYSDRAPNWSILIVSNYDITDEAFASLPSFELKLQTLSIAGNQVWKPSQKCVPNWKDLMPIIATSHPFRRTLDLEIQT
eukprot:CAMPEP_0178920016 /NCGR_PEP_ID=MMETSP0786-20121207/14765_1 /TAXON_ID=186022 /ORGANISM="Thalassionema frauenfeldii, Strain CCMP 1798" /LENGTH=87 /DNA_ID=CAMNT_0020594025 /DNA_START=530 /DNA_END=793 /DNA_ORIENTATION=+